MSRCVECGQEVQTIINPETQTVENCESCGSSSDPYFEFNSLHLWIDMILLQRRAWIHILYNSTVPMKIYLQCACISCLLEAFVCRSKSVIERNTSNVSLNSIQIIKMMDNSILSVTHYPTTVPALFFFSISECVFIFAIFIWVGRHFGPQGGRYMDVVKRWIKAACVVTTVKIAYALFLVWSMPLSALQIVDYVYFMWLFRAVSAMILGNSAVFSILHVTVMSLLVGSRVFFRYLTEWSSQIL